MVTVSYGAGDGAGNGDVDGLGITGSFCLFVSFRWLDVSIVSILGFSLSRVGYSYLYFFSCLLLLVFLRFFECLRLHCLSRYLSPRYVRVISFCFPTLCFLAIVTLFLFPCRCLLVIMSASGDDAGASGSDATVRAPSADVSLVQEAVPASEGSFLILLRWVPSWGTLCLPLLLVQMLSYLLFLCPLTLYHDPNFSCVFTSALLYMSWSLGNCALPLFGPGSFNCPCLFVVWYLTVVLFFVRTWRLICLNCQKILLEDIEDLQLSILNNQHMRGDKSNLRKYKLRVTRLTKNCGVMMITMAPMASVLFSSLLYLFVFPALIWIAILHGFNVCVF
jgi:hypothetical protein